MTRSPTSLSVLAAGLAVAGGAVWAQQPAKSGCDPGNADLTLPAGFCASIAADNLGPARHMVSSPRGDLYVMLNQERQGGGVVALRDSDGDGRFERQERFGHGLHGTGIGWRGDHLYVGADDRIVRYRMAAGELVPTAQPEIIVDGFAQQRGHPTKPIAFGDNGEMYVAIGAPSNACQGPDRRPEARGQQPCPLLQLHGGVWKYDAARPRQKHAADKRIATGIRHDVGITWNPVTHALYGVQNGRDSLDTLWPKRFTAEQNATLPGEELQRILEGSNFGWPYCYFDLSQKKRVLAPEYGGGGTQEGDCAKYDKPLATFPAHNAPLSVLFYSGTQFPAEYRNGAFIAFHGSWNREPLPMDGYNVRFLPFKGDAPAADRVFASGFAGTARIMSPEDAKHRPVGLAQGRDGSLLVSDDVKGRVWRISYTR
jgi:glucose/arabinose dehydrogenase